MRADVLARRGVQQGQAISAHSTASNIARCLVRDVRASDPPRRLCSGPMETEERSSATYPESAPFAHGWLDVGRAQHLLGFCGHPRESQQLCCTAVRGRA